MPGKVEFGENTSFKARINQNEFKKVTKHEVIGSINKSKNSYQYLLKLLIAD